MFTDFINWIDEEIMEAKAKWKKAQVFLKIFMREKYVKLFLLLVVEALSKLMVKTPSEKIVFLGDKEIDILRRIREETDSLNLNNITRTRAYLDFYLENEEIHWSFLAHMVSRNGGWNMTDLKGSILRELLSTNKVQLFFEFLEQANAEIFHDAYAQLLLYRYSKQSGRNFFYLLPHLSVSTFMKPIWKHFFKTKQSSLITVALIINEQHLIQRLIDHPTYQKELLNTILFKAQARLGFTNVLFPYRNAHRIEVAGVTVQNFENVNYRISIGKTLYGILFHEILAAARSFAFQKPHTGSRADFWPDIFTKKDSKINESVQHPFIFSPTLKQAWPNIQHKIQIQKDWYTSPKVLNQLTEYYIPAAYNLTTNYKNDLKSLVLMNELKNMLN